MRERHPYPGFLGLDVVARDYVQLVMTAAFSRPAPEPVDPWVAPLRPALLCRLQWPPTLAFFRSPA